jgi:biotin transport system substrate-specific component
MQGNPAAHSVFSRMLGKIEPALQVAKGEPYRMTTIAPILYSRTFPRSSEAARSALLIVVGSLLLAALAQVRIPLPFTPVPITGQTFGVLLIGAALGARNGAASMLLYVIEGAAGLPFFAGGSGGLHVLTGATAGYLAGFIVAASVVGLLAERGFDRSLRTSLVPFLVGTLIIYLFGVSWLSYLLHDVRSAVTLGLLPFIPGDILKLIAAALALPAAWRLVKG